MKTFGKVVLIVVAVVVVGVVGVGVALWQGWMPVPTPVIAAVAKAKGMSPAQAQSMEKAAKVYQSARKTAAAPYVDRALALARGHASADQWKALAVEAWPQLKPADLEQFRQDLGAPQADWDQATALAARQIDRIQKGQEPQLTAAEQALVQKLADETGIVDLVRGLQ